MNNIVVVNRDYRVFRRRRHLIKTIGCSNDTYISFSFSFPPLIWMIIWWGPMHIYALPFNVFHETETITIMRNKSHVIVCHKMCICTPFIVTNKVKQNFIKMNWNHYWNSTEIWFLHRQNHLNFILMNISRFQ